MNPAGRTEPAPTSQHTSGVDYHATSERIHYDDLSPAVRAAADTALGSPVVRAAPPVTSGFTNAYAGGVLLRDGRRAFLKAAGPEFRFPVLSLGREAQVLEALDDLIPSVALVGAGTSIDGGQVLALEWVEGHLPGLPWAEDEIDLVRSACESVADVPSSALAALTPVQLVDDFLESQSLSDALTNGLRPPSSSNRLPGWLPARIDEVIALAADTDALRVSSQLGHLNHGDLRPDNLLIGRGAGEARDRAYVLDWNWVALGPPWCDWVGLIPAMQAQGHDLGELLDSTALSRSADPHAVDVWLALVAVFMLSCLDEPPPGGRHGGTAPASAVHRGDVPGVSGHPPRLALNNSRLRCRDGEPGSEITASPPHPTALQPPRPSFVPPRPSRSSPRSAPSSPARPKVRPR